jgi:cell division protease FtsH
MVAEELFFGEITSGPAGDLRAATTWAATMIGSLGMDGSLFSYEAVDAPHANLVAKVSSTEDGKERIEALLNRSREDVRTMLGANRHVVEGLRDVLLDREELIGEEITDAIVAAAALTAKPAPARTLSS